MAKIAVVGAGTIGQATTKGFLNKGHEVVLLDINEGLLAQLRNKGYDALHVRDINLVDIDAVFVSVPSPTTGGLFVFDDIEAALKAIGKALGRAIEDYSQKYRVVVIRSTVLPGTTEQKVLPVLEKNSGRKAGQDFGVCMNPEYLRERQAEDDFANPRIIVIGENDQRAGQTVEEIYQPINCPLYRVPIRVAEFQKYVHNLFNAAKISFFNEMRQVSKALDIDNASKVFILVAQSAEGMWNPMYGTHDFGPFGGKCLPKDVQAFLNFTQKELNISMPMLEATMEVNRYLSNSAR